MSFVKPTIQAWSYSRLSTWEECPAKAKYKFVNKLPEPDSPYAARGSDIHKMAEEYITGKVPELPVPLKEVGTYIEELKGGHAELQLAFAVDWKPTSWFGPQVYCRVIFDAAVVTPPVVVVADHKTGKKREEEHTDQLRLYGLAAMKQWPEATRVDAQVIYVDHGERLRMTFSKSVERELQEYWDERAGKMRADDIFPARPNPKCRWCHFRKSNGGPCQFS